MPWASHSIQRTRTEVLNLKSDLAMGARSYGLVTTGRIWEIGKLDGQIATIQPINLSLAQLDLLLGVLDYLFAQCEAQLENMGLN